MEELYDLLVAEGDYVGTFQEFENDWGEDNYKSLHSQLSRNQDYVGEYDQFLLDYTPTNTSSLIDAYVQDDINEIQQEPEKVFERIEKDADGNESVFTVEKGPKQILTELGKKDIEDNYKLASESWNKLTTNDDIADIDPVDNFKQKAIYIQDDLIKNNKYLNYKNKQILKKVDDFFNSKGGIRDKIIEDYNLNDPNVTAETLEEANKDYNDQRSDAAELMAENDSQYQEVLNSIGKKINTTIGSELAEFQKNKARSEVEFKIPFTDILLPKIGSVDFGKGISDNNIVEGLQSFAKGVIQDLYGIELMGPDQGFGRTTKITKAINSLEEKIKNNEINVNDKVDRDTKITMQGFIKDPNMTVKETLKFLNDALDERKEEQFETIKDIQDIDKDLQLFTENKIWEEDGSVDLTIKELGGIAGQQLPQIGLALAVGGVGVMAQEIGGNYINNLNEIAKQKFNLPENAQPTAEQLMDIINNGEDEKGIAIATGTVAGYLEKISAGRILKVDLKKPIGSIVRGEFKTAIKSLANSGKAVTNATLLESATEGLQGGLSQAGESFVTDENRFDLKELREQSSQGALMGGGLSSFKVGVTQTAVETKQAAMKIAGALGSEGKLGQLEKSFKLLQTKIKADGRLNPETVNNRLKALGQVRNALNSIPKDYTTEQREKALQLLIRKQDIDTQFQNTSKSMIPQSVQDQLESIDNQLGKIAEDAYITRTVDMAQKEGVGENVLVAKTSKQADRLASENNMSMTDKSGNRAEGAASADTETIIIDLEQAKKVKAFNVAGHELLHRVLFNTLYKINKEGKLEGTKVARSLGIELDKQLNKIDPSILKNEYLKERFKLYKDQGKTMQAEEKLTILSDALRLGEITLNESSVDKFNSFFRRLFQNLGWKKIKFKDGKDVINFIVDYNKSLDKGQLGKAIKQGAVEGFEVVRGKDGIKQLTDDINITQKPSKSADIDALVGPKTDGQYTLTKAEWDAGKADETLSKIFPKLQGLIESKIPIDRPPGFSQEDFISGTVEELIPHIRNFNPEQNNSLSGWINSQLQNKIGNVFKKGEAATKEVFEDDVTQAKGVTEVQETVEEVIPETQTASKLRKIVGVERKRGLEIARNIVKGKLPDLNDKKLRSQINRQARDEYLTEIRDLLNDLTDNQKLEIVKTLPVQDLVKLERLQKDKIFAKIVANNISPTQVDKAIKEGKLPKGTNRLSGPKLYERLDVTAEQVADFFTSKKRNAFAGVIAENLVKDALPEVTAETESKQRRARAEEAQGRKVVEKDREQLLEKVERDPGLKFSKSFKGAPEYVIELGKKLNTRLTKNSIDKALVDINNELTDELFDVYNKKYFQPYIKARKAADKMAWPNAEETVLKNIKILENKIPGIKITQVELNKDAQKVDIEFILNGDKVFIEVKKNDQARLSQVYLHRNKKNKVYATENRADKKYIDRIIKEDSNNRNVLIDFIKEKYPNEIFEEKRGDKINIVVTPGAYYGAKRQLAKQNKAVEKRLKLPIDFVSDIYNRKNTYYIDFGDIGTFYMNKNPQNFPVASLLQENKDGKLIDVEVRTQWKPSKPRANGNFTISRIAVPTLTNEAKKVLSDTETLSMQNEQQAEIVLNVGGNKILASKLNNSILPPVDKLKGNFNNTEVLNKMAEVDNASVKEETKFSKSANLSKGFNEILEKKTGIAADKTYSKVKAQVVGANKGRFNFFIPPSAEDFVGLLYKTLGKGKLGDSQMAWYKAHLLNPFARAMDNLTRDRVALMNDFKALKKELKVVPKTLKKKIPGEGFTQEQAVRVYIWNKQKMDIPGMKDVDVKELVKFVNSKKDLKLFANQLIALQKGDLYAAPRDGWNAGTITTDLIEGINTTKRAKYLEVWQQNVDEIFSQENLNKLEAIYGKEYRGALENILKRMQTGRNRTFPGDSLTGRFTDWLSNSIGAIMFFNMRSAVLQTISTVNFINFKDNNILAASKAFANQPQFWTDFKKLFNSDFLVDRRAGLKLNVQEADIAELAKKGGVRGVISELLRLGFLPTQLADSFAISSGGATFYRNRIKTLEKQGFTPKEAEKQAFQDFREVAEESQQSSRPDRISSQQAGPLGRIILAFQNTPMQYARLIKKAASDLKNGRGDAKTNISKILYYGFVQNLIFNSLQQAAFALGFGDTEEEEEKREKKYYSILNSMADSIIRGTGVAGVIFATIKNTLIKLEKESKKKAPKYQDAVLELAQASPPLGSKIRKIQAAGRSYSWNKKEMLEKGWSIDNPAYLAAGQVIAATTNIPLDRAFKKIDNIRNSSRSDLEAWQRIALIAGWSDWDLGIKDVKTKSTKTRKTKKKKVKKPKRKF